MKENKEKSIILGLGTDHKDQHKRITKGDNFYLLGGSEQTHDMMVEEVLLFNELLKQAGKTLNHLSEKEYYYLVKEVKKRLKYKSLWTYSQNFNHLNN